LGDDLRHVNWNLWARTDNLYIKQFRADTNLNLYIMVDNSCSMLAKNGNDLKWRYAARAAAALAYLARIENDAPGLFMLGDGIQDYIPPSLKPTHFRRIQSLLASSKPNGVADINKSLRQSAELCPRKGVIVIISDLFEYNEELLRNMKNYKSMGHDVIVMQIIDPWEVDLPENGEWEFTDLETSEKIRINAKKLRKPYRSMLEDWQKNIEYECEGAGIEWLSCRTDMSLRTVLIDYLLKRARF
jgi:uncharacterized protein (DUF58 family)